ncbi:MAG TPA: sodium:solute symporter family protein, partial [Casimicrobium sp.]|nr:sodium:solute symporter family protein [Casimicrobium sp.]
GLFFAAKLYKLTLLTISDYYRQRFGKAVEILCSIIIMLSYLGWVAAQVTALGLVFNILSAGSITFEWGMVLGVASILIYTLFGGMWSVALTDFIQMIVLVVGLSIIAVMAGNMAGGADKVIAYAQSKDMFRFFPEPSFKDMLFFFAASITMMLGSIPQQDVFQRVMSAKDVKAATHGPVIGGICYLLFAFVPMFLVVAALIIMPEQTAELLKGDTQKILPTLVLERMPFIAQVIFFGALLSAIKSTASATLLAPSITFVENVYKHFRPHMSDAQTLRAMRVSTLVFSLLVLGYAMATRGTKIYDMVSGAYQVTLVGAFVPLAFGLYWKRATTQGALASVVLGLGTWLLVYLVPGWSEAFPQQLAGLIASLVGMLVGSLAPQVIANHRGHVHHFLGSDVKA